MVRRGQGRQSLNSSVTVTNSSILDDKEQEDQEYSEFIKKFRVPDLDNVSLVGYEKTIATIRRRLDKLLSADSTKQRFALITGPSGTGKTTVVRKLAHEYSEAKGNRSALTFLYLKASWTLEGRFGNPEARIVSLFDEAIKKAPALVFIDRLDMVCAEKRSQNDRRDRVINVLEDELERLKTLSAKVLVLAATTKPEALDLQVRNSYFRDEIQFLLPSRQDRVNALKNLMKQFVNDLNDEQLNEIADLCHCYTYEDLETLCDIASEEINDSAPIDYSSVKLALKRYKPVTIKSITTPCRPVYWRDIGGVESAKRELQVSVIWPLKNRTQYQKMGAQAIKGALLYGPPGCSKTMLARALATESGYNFISIKGPELFSKWVGDSEAAVRRLYRNAREIAPCIIFLDEIDGFAPERSDDHSSPVGDRVVTALLGELDGVEPLDDVFTIAATNRPHKVDSALLRPGRLDEAIYIPLPDEQDRREIFKVHMRGLALDFTGSETLDTIVDKLAKRTCGFSGAEISKVCVKASRLAVESPSNEHIEWRHFEAALDTVCARTKAEHLEAFERFQANSHTVASKTRNGQPPRQQQPLDDEQQSRISRDESIRNSAKGGATWSRERSALNRLLRSLRLKRRITK